MTSPRRDEQPAWPAPADEPEVEAKADRRRETAARMRAILDGALDAVVGMDATGRVTFWNGRAEQMFGWSREEALGQVLADLIVPAGQREAHHRGLQAFLRTGQTKLLNRRVEITALRRDGTEFPVELAVTPIREGDFYTFSGFIRDITDRKRAEAEREGLLVAAEKARDDAEAASRAKDQFLATLSHELRTPLTSIVGWTYLLRSGRPEAATLARGLEVIDRNAMLQAQLVSEILDMSRILAARFRLHTRPLQLAPLVAAAIDSLLPAARAKGIRLQPVLDPSAGAVLGDPDRLQQVVWNLVSNAIKFTPQDGRVQVHLAAADGAVRISVEDSGIGIPPDFLPHVFELFRQRDSSNTRTHGGLGLGLAVVRHLVELHGGSVSAESAGEGRGATFTVTLPVLRGPADIRVPEPSSEPAEPAPSDAAAPDLTGTRVVLADSGPDVREVLSRVLSDAGAEVTAVGTAAEALDAVVRQLPHVLVTAIEMPDETGFALVRKIRSLPEDKGGRTATVALSGHSRSEDRVQSLLAGFQMHVVKPVQPAELVAVVYSLARRGPA